MAEPVARFSTASGENYRLYDWTGLGTLLGACLTDGEVLLADSVKPPSATAVVTETYSQMGGTVQ